jgi:putative transcriptional regulator
MNMDASNQKLINALEEVIAYKQGEKSLHKTPIVPPQVNVKSIRDKLHLSQQEFARRYGFPVATVKNWEQKRRQPEGAARILLKVIERNPAAVDEALMDERGFLDGGARA